MKKKIILNLIICVIAMGVSIFASCNHLPTDEVDCTVNYMDGQTLLHSSVITDGSQINTSFTPQESESKIFAGWYIDEALTTPVSIANMPTGDVNVYAKWIDKTFTVKFLGIDNTEIESQTIVYGESATAPIPPKVVGFHFTTWNEDFSCVKSDLTIHAQYNKNINMLSFYIGDNQIFNREIEEGAYIAPYAESALDNANSYIPNGFLFDSWQINGSSLNEDTIMPDENTSVIAKLKIDYILPIITGTDVHTFSRNLKVSYSATSPKINDSQNISITSEWLLNGLPCNNPDSISITSVGDYTLTLNMLLSADGCADVSISVTKSFNVIKGTIVDEYTAVGVDTVYDAKSHNVAITNKYYDDTINQNDVIYYRTSTDEEWSTNNPSFKNVGEYQVYYKIINPNYYDYVVETPLSVKIKKAELTVKVKSESIYYGDDIPSFTIASYDGLKGNDTSTVVSGSPTFICGIENSRTLTTSYIRIFSGLSAENYNISYEDGSITVLPRPVTITADNKTVTYGDDIPTFTASYQLLGNDIVTVSFSCSYTTKSDIGVYEIIPSAKNDNYNFSFANGNLSVTAKDAKIIAIDKTINYGDALPSFDCEFEGVNSDDEIDVKYSSSYSIGNGIGNYKIIPSAENKNYNFKFVNGNLLVTAKNATITANNQTTIYGYSASRFKSKIDGLYNEDKISVQYTCSYSMFDDVGDYEIIPYAKDDNYNFTFVKGILSVSPHDATITANDKTIIYGSNASFDYVAKGLYIKSNIEVTFSCNYRAGNDIGNYAIIPFAQNKNYNFTFVNGNLSVTAKNATITANNKNIIYGEKLTSFDFIADGLYRNSDAEVTFDCDYEVGNVVGKYDIIPVVEKNDNYCFTLINGTLDVSPKDISLSIIETQAYINDNTRWQKSITSIDGLVSGDTVSGTIYTISGVKRSYIDKDDFIWTQPLDIKKEDGSSVLICYNVTITTNITIEERTFEIIENCVDVTYDKSAHFADVTTDELCDYTIWYGYPNKVYNLSSAPEFIDVGKYTIYYKIIDNSNKHSPATGSLTFKILPKAATIIADDKIVTYGDNKPNLTATKSGIIEGDTIDYILTTKYVANSNVGNYDISILLGANKNYNITAIGATISVGKKALTITAADKNVIYGDDKPDFSSDAPDSINVIYSCDYNKGGNAGSYDINVSADNSNYDFTFIKGTLTVGKKEITITAANKTISYGDEIPTYSSETTIDVNVYFDCSYKVGDDHGSYNIIPYCDENTNYDFKYVNGILTVNRKEISIKVDDKTIIYGENAPTYTADYSLLFDDTITLDFICPYTSESDVGEYSITANGASNDNYIFSYTSGTLIVTQKTISVVWNGLDAIYTYNGKDQSSSITASFATIQFNDANEFIDAGEYTLTAFPINNNYLLNNTSATVTMNKATYKDISHRILSGTYAPTQTISDFVLDNGFTWAVALDTIPDVATKNYLAIYNKDGCINVNYNELQVDIIIDLNKATAIMSGLFVQEFDCDGTSTHIFDKSKLIAKYNDKAVVGDIVLSGDYAKTNGGTYMLTATLDSANYQASQICYMKVKSVDVNGVLYTIEDALKNAQNGTITIKYDTSFSESSLELYSTEEYYTVKNGVTLLLPFNESDTKGWIGAGDSDSDNYIATPVSNGTPTLYLSLTIPSSITMFVKGDLVIGAVTGQQKAGTKQNKISGAYSQIILDGIIEGNDAIIRCVGYIIGSGKIIANNSTIIENIYLSGWMGGTIAAPRYTGNTSVAATKLLGDSMSFDNPNMFPFSQYELRSIQAKLIINYGSNLKGYAKIATSKLTAANLFTIKAQINEAYLSFISSDSNAASGLIHMTSSTSHVEKTFANDRVRLELFGSFKDGYSSIDTKVVNCMVSMSSEKVEFPIDGRTDIILKNGSSFTQSYKYKFMPGATLTIENSATYTMNNSLIMYTSEFHDVSTYPYPGAARGDSKLIVNGIMNINGGFGGDIYSNALGKVSIGENALLSVKSINGSGSIDVGVKTDFIFTEEDSVTKSATFKNADDTMISAEKGYNYEYKEGTWKKI